MDDQRLDRIEGKLDKISTRMGNIDVTLAAQHVSLKEHMRRSDLLEAKLQPIERQKYMIDGMLKLVGMLAVIVGIAEGIAAVLTYLHGGQ